MARIKLAVAIAALICSSATEATSGSCPLTQSFAFPDKSLSGPVGDGPGNSIIFTGRLRVNTDGSARSYHPLGSAAPGPIKPSNFICNAISVTLSDGTRFSAKSNPDCHFITQYYVPSRENGWLVSKDYKIGWYAIAHNAIKDGRYQPCIQSTGPFAGFFVSMTRLAANPTLPDCDPAHWVNSDLIPYITLPPDDRLMRGGNSIGSLALIRARIDGTERMIVAVVADQGVSDELGEGSVALHRSLRGLPLDELAAPRSYDPGKGVTTVLFPDERAKLPITFESLQAERDRLVALLGNKSTADSCLRRSAP